MTKCHQVPLATSCFFGHLAWLRSPSPPGGHGVAGDSLVALACSGAHRETPALGTTGVLSPWGPPTPPQGAYWKTMVQFCQSKGK